jgi:signal transduction histidine kinase
MTVIALTSACICFAGAGFAGAVRVRRRQAILAMCLHELRGALTTARLAADLLTIGGLDEPMLCTAASDELERSYHSLGAFEEILYAPLIDFGRLLPWRVRTRRRTGLIDVRTELERLAFIWGEAANRRGRGLEFAWFGATLPIQGDRRHLIETVTNLLSNAVRHGEGTIRLSGRRRGDSLRVEVADDGPGLPAPVTELSRGRRLGPHGHGLAVAVRAVGKLGGSITSGPSSGGSLIVVDLPLRGSDRAGCTNQDGDGRRVGFGGDAEVRELHPVGEPSGES